MDTRTARSTADLPALIAFPLVDAYQCERCGASIEVPRWAVLVGGARPVRIKSDPLNHLLWLEEQAAKHKGCPVRRLRHWYEPVIRVWRAQA